jgi:hypothetical protein
MVPNHPQVNRMLYLVQGNTNAIELSAIAAGTSTDGFVINGESADDWSGYSVSSAGDVNPK